MGRARRDMQGAGLEIERKVCGASTVHQGLSCILVNRTCVPVLGACQSH